MEEKHAKQIYQQLRQEFSNQNPNQIDEITQSMEKVFNNMITLVEDQEKKRSQSIAKLKQQLMEIISEYWHGPFATQYEQIKQLKEKAREEWKDIQPRMEALAQIKNILRQNFLKPSRPQ